MSAYRSEARTDRPQLLAVTRPASKTILAVLGLGSVFMAAVGFLTRNMAFVPVALVFAASVVVILLLRQKTVIYEDRILQGRLVKRTLVIAETRHVFHRDAGRDPSLGVTAVSAAQLDEVLLVSRSGVKVTLPTVDVPAELRGEIVQSALAAAVKNAEDLIASGGTYRDPDNLHGLDASQLHGFKVGLTLKKVTTPLADVVTLGSSGVVGTKDGEAFSIGQFDAVLAELLRRRGLGR